MPLPSAELKVEDMPNCPKGQELCGFTPGMTILIYDNQGHFDFFTVTQVQDPAGHVQHRQQDLSYAYQPGAIVTQADSHTYYFDSVNKQLRHYDGYLTDVSVVDNVVGVKFEYFGDPNPPLKPKPELGTANCCTTRPATTSRGMTDADPAGWLAGGIAAVDLNDGPWCGDGNNRFDADLFRVKKVRVTLRVQASSRRFGPLAASSPRRASTRARSRTSRTTASCSKSRRAT